MSDREDRDGLSEKLVNLNRVSKVLKGGRRFSFAALMVVGDQKGKVGYGYRKANDVSEAIRKSSVQARQNMVSVSMKKRTIPHQVQGRFKGAKILLKPATPGTGVIAGGAVRAVMEMCGIHDILSKSLGSNNQLNIIKAVFKGLELIIDADEMAAAHGKSRAEMWG